MFFYTMCNSIINVDILCHIDVGHAFCIVSI